MHCPIRAPTAIDHRGFGRTECRRTGIGSDYLADLDAWLDTIHRCSGDTGGSQHGRQSRDALRRRATAPSETSDQSEGFDCRRRMPSRLRALSAMAQRSESRHPVLRATPMYPDYDRLAESLVRRQNILPRERADFIARAGRPRTSKAELNCVPTRDTSASIHFSIAAMKCARAGGKSRHPSCSSQPRVEHYRGYVMCSPSKSCARIFVCTWLRRKMPGTCALGTTNEWRNGFKNPSRTDAIERTTRRAAVVVGQRRRRDGRFGDCLLTIVTCGWKLRLFSSRHRYLSRPHVRSRCPRWRID